MELLNAIRVASALAGDRPVAFICGRPPRVVASVLWTPLLTAEAMQLWSDCRPSAVRGTAQLTVFACVAKNGAVEGMLVVASAVLDAAKRQSLVALSGILKQLGGTVVADLLNRLECDDPDPGLRRDFDRFLRDMGFNIRRAAQLMGVSRPTVYKHIRRLGITIDRLRAGVSDRGKTP